MRWKFLLFLLAVAIGLSSLLYTGKLMRELKKEERKKVELWAKATQQLIDIDASSSNFDFLFEIVENNTTVPVLLINEDSTIVSSRNMDEKKIKNHAYLFKQLRKMGKEHPPMEISLGNGIKNFIYYKDSTVLTKLKYFPYVQLSVIILFILVAYLAFSAARRSEQNKLWLGLSRETAHQLGTPTSSLLAWLEILKGREQDPDLVRELEKDIKRLEKITERFSKIGSKPVLEPTDLNQIIRNVIQYMNRRTSEKIVFRLNIDPRESFSVPMNAELFEWVIENLCKNAVDAMKGKGTIDINITDNTQFVYIDVQDYGMGIPKSKYKTVFKPGYTTKDRGWGLGLSLSKRIIEEYHRGRLFINNSELRKGTVFRIVLHKKVNFPA